MTKQFVNRYKGNPILFRNAIAVNSSDIPNNAACQRLTLREDINVPICVYRLYFFREPTPKSLLPDGDHKSPPLVALYINLHLVG